MFSGLKAITLASLAILAVANQPTSPSQCDTGDLQCCQSTQSSAPSPTSFVGGLLNVFGLDAQAVALPIGVTCSPITVIGAGNSGCNAQPVCCSNNKFNGVVALGCSPVSL